MSYEVTVLETDWKVSVEHDAILAKIKDEFVKKLAQEEIERESDILGRISTDRTFVGHVDVKALVSKNSLEDALGLTCFALDERGYIYAEDILTWDSEFAVLFVAMAPFVEKGSYVKFQGEDGARWEYVVEENEDGEIVLNEYDYYYERGDAKTLR